MYPMNGEERAHAEARNEKIQELISDQGKRMYDIPLVRRMALFPFQIQTLYTQHLEDDEPKECNHYHLQQDRKLVLAGDTTVLSHQQQARYPLHSFQEPQGGDVLPQADTGSEVVASH